MNPLLIFGASQGGGSEEALIMIIAFVLLVMGIGLFVIKCYKRCPSNKILVVYGKVGGGQASQCLHGGGKFVIPLLQDYQYLHLDPIQIEIQLTDALSNENIRVNIPSVFTVAIGTQAALMHNAAVRLLGRTIGQIQKTAEEIIFEQLRQVIASMSIEEINRDREKLLGHITDSLEPELEKVGLVLINVNITDITDKSGYIDAIGRKAASEAIQQAEIDVADQRKRGAIGVAEAQREKEVQVANAQKSQMIGTKEAEREQAVRVAELEKETVVGEQAAAFERESQVKNSEREMRIQVADANAKAVEGENLSKARVADANAALRVTEAEAYQKGETRHREADAAVREAQYLAEATAAKALASKVEEEKRAELEAVAKANKAKQIVDAEALAERRRIEAEGEAAAIFARLDAKARGEFEVLAKKGEGLGHIVSNCGSPQAAFQLLMLEELEHLSETAAKAISNIKFDKVIVWDGGGGNGTGGTAGFLQSLAGSLPPVMKIMKDIGGIEMPDYFGKMVEDSQDSDKEIKTSRPSPPKRGREGARRAARNKPTAPPKNDPSDRSNREDPPGNTPNS